MKNVKIQIWNEIESYVISKIRPDIISREVWKQVRRRVLWNVRDRIFNQHYNQITTSIRNSIHGEQQE